MEKIRIGKSETLYEINSIKITSTNVLQIDFANDIPKEYGDITVYTSGGLPCATLPGYDTIYRQDGQTVYLSNDGSVYTEPETFEVEEYEPTLAERKTSKLAEVSAACSTTIAAGCDVTLPGEVKHFALKEADQINLSAAVTAVEQGAAGYPYHADGELCKVYSAADILAIGEAATAYKLYHTTYCNYLNAWIKRCEDASRVEAITYGAEMPEDLAENMAAILAAVSGGAG